MAFTLDDVRQDVDMELQDDKPFFTTGERDTAIQLALKRINRDRPREEVVEVAGDGTQDYDVPPNYQRGFSEVRQIEFPAGQIPPVILAQDDDWIEYEDPTQTPTNRILFLALTPGTSEKIRITIRRPHDLTNDSSTSTVIDQNTFQALVYKSLSNIFRAKGSKFLESNDPVIGADTVDFGVKGQTFLFLANEWERDYKAAVGIGAEQVKADDAFADADVKFGHGEAFLFHGRKQR